jgi:hypothetical protein
MIVYEHIGKFNWYFLVAESFVQQYRRSSEIKASAYQTWENWAVTDAQVAVDALLAAPELPQGSSRRIHLMNK